VARRRSSLKVPEVNAEPGKERDPVVPDLGVFLLLAQTGPGVGEGAGAPIDKLTTRAPPTGSVRSIAFVAMLACVISGTRDAALLFPNGCVAAGRACGAKAGKRSSDHPSLELLCPVRMCREDQSRLIDRPR
jgi:hypothetical protein